MGNRSHLVILMVLIWGVGCAHGTKSDSVQDESRQPSSASILRRGDPPPEVIRSQKLMWPIATRKISQKFSPPTRKKNGHEGIDIRAPNGTRIYATDEGRVVYAGSKFNGYGKLVIIEHLKKGISTFYGHCSKLLVKTGEMVDRGTLIAQVGRTGRATGNHLHFEVRKGYDPVNPLEYLP